MSTENEGSIRRGHGAQTRRDTTVLHGGAIRNEDVRAGTEPRREIGRRLKIDRTDTGTFEVGVLVQMRTIDEGSVRGAGWGPAVAAQASIRQAQGEGRRRDPRSDATPTTTLDLTNTPVQVPTYLHLDLHEMAGVGGHGAQVPEERVAHGGTIRGAAIPGRTGLAAALFGLRAMGMKLGIGGNERLVDPALAEMAEDQTIRLGIVDRAVTREDTPLGIYGAHPNARTTIALSLTTEASDDALENDEFGDGFAACEALTGPVGEGFMLCSPGLESLLWPSDLQRGLVHDLLKARLINADDRLEEVLDVIGCYRDANGGCEAAQLLQVFFDAREGMLLPSFRRDRRVIHAEGQLHTPTLQGVGGLSVHEGTIRGHREADIIAASFSPMGHDLVQEICSEERLPPKKTDRGLAPLRCLIHQPVYGLEGQVDGHASRLLWNIAKSAVHVAALGQNEGQIGYLGKMHENLLDS